MSVAEGGGTRMYISSVLRVQEELATTVLFPMHLLKWIVNRQTSLSPLNYLQGKYTAEFGNSRALDVLKSFAVQIFAQWSHRWLAPRLQR